MLLLLPLILNSVGVLAWEPVFRIVGGDPVSICERPFQVLIYRSTHLGVVPDCGGAIINNRWILTAAHCVNNELIKNIFVRAGLDDLTDRSLGTWYRVRKSIPHKGFSSTQLVLSNDIALLMTEKEILFTSNIQPIKLARKKPKPLDEAVISGFGVTAQGSITMSSILRVVSVTVLDRDDCLDLLDDIMPGLIISETQFCAAYLEGGKDACQGDSGGPVTINGSLTGIVSWGLGCAQKNVPAFYTDVFQYRSWVNSVVKRSSPRP